MKSNAKNDQYHQKLLKTFASLYHKNQDLMQNMPSVLPIPNPLRQQILFTQYPMEKKGKNFGTVEERTFRIDEQSLKQIDKNGQERDLPFPTSVCKQHISHNIKNQWGFIQYSFRLLLQFEERNPIYVYIKTKQQLSQIYSFLCSKASPQQKDILKQAYNQFYKMKMMNYLVKKLSAVSLSKRYGGNKQHMRLSVISKLKSELTNVNLLRKFMSQWHHRAVMIGKDPEKMQEHEKSSILNVKNIVSELTFAFDHIKNISQFQIREGQLKLWVGQKTFEKSIRFTKESILTQQSPIQQNKIDINKIDPFRQIRIFTLKGNQIRIRNENPPLSIWTTLQFQLQTKNEHQKTMCWRSERFYVIDLIKALTAGIKKSITLWNGKIFVQLLTTIVSVKCQALKIELPPQHQSFPSSYNYNLTPNRYPILRQIIPLTILKKYIKNLNPQNLHLQYTVAYQQYLQTQSVQCLSFSSFHKLYELLQIDSIIQKFYTNPPYNQYINIEHKGTFVYEYLVKIADKFAYYDAQKFIFKYQCTGLRRFLSAIKAFDQFPRINYTEPFYHLCLQCMKLAERQSLIKWKSHRFSNTLLGRQSLAFFMILGILKSSSQLLLYQTNRNVLASNTLLFHYVLKKYTRSLYNKFLHLQLNIEAFFGMSIASMLSSLFFSPNCDRKYGGSQQIFTFILISYLLQRKQHSPTARSESLNKFSKQLQQIRSKHYISHIAMFLAIIQLFDTIISTSAAQKIKSKNNTQNKLNESIVGSSAAYCTGNTYLQYLRIFVNTQLQIYMSQIIILHHKYSVFCSNQLQQKSEYITLQQNLQLFHNQNNASLALGSNMQTEESTMFSNKQMNINNKNNNATNIANMGIGELIQQIYQQFMCYKYKNEADIRKICIVIDHIYFGQFTTVQQAHNKVNMSSSTYRPPSLLIQLMQSNTKIYQHQYILSPSCLNSPNKQIALQNIKHIIQLKLSRLSVITIILTCLNTGTTQPSYATTIDPTEISSNYYIQLIKQLIPINPQHTANKIQQIGNQLYRQCYMGMQVYIKDSCEVDYIQNTVPNQYINLLLLRDRITGDTQDYKKDVIFCNQYFRTFRLTENNFNLLYAKLGWYGNHYLIPADRLVQTKLVVPNPFATKQANTKIIQSLPTNIQNNPETLTSLSLSYSQLSVKRMPNIHTQRMNEILFYTRCIFGRGLVPSIAYTGYNGVNSSTQVIIESVRGNSILIKQSKNVRNEINQYQYNSCGNMITYPLENFNTLNCYQNQRCVANQGIKSLNKSSFTDFYMRATQQLPLIRYLCFRPLEFYLLEEIKLILKVPIISNSISPEVLAKQYSSNPQQQMAKTSRTYKQSSQQYNYASINSSSVSTITTRSFQIVLTNHPILANANKNVKNSNQNLQLLPYKFLSDPSQISFPDMYCNYENVDTIESDGWGRTLFIKLVEGVDLPSVMYFTYPTGIQHTTKNQQIQMTIDGLSGSGSREMLLNQFLWLLKCNIYKYYVKQKQKLRKQEEIVIKPGDKKQKPKLNYSESINKKVLDCQFQFSDQLIPNTNIANFFQFVCQTKQPIELHANPIFPIIFTDLTQSTKNMQPILLYPLILTPIYRHYTSYTLIGGGWVAICILAKLLTPTYQLYYIQEKSSRKLRIVKSSDTLLGIEGKRTLERLPAYKFTDHQVLNGKQCVRKELIRIL